MRRILSIVCLVLGIISEVYFILILFRGITFAPFFAVIGILFISCAMGIKYINENSISKKAKFAIKLIRLIILFLLISFIIIESFIIYYGNKNENVKADYVIVLGAGVRGKTPSLILYERLKKALNYHNINPDVKIILSGGQGKLEDITEAEAMKRYLVGKGVDENLIVEEDKSTSTAENLKYSKQKILELGGKQNSNIVIITSNFHMFRAQYLAKNNGFKANGISAPIPLWLVPTYYVREYLGVVKTYISYPLNSFQ